MKVEGKMNNGAGRSNLQQAMKASPIKHEKESAISIYVRIVNQCGSLISLAEEKVADFGSLLILELFSAFMLASSVVCDNCEVMWFFNQFSRRKSCRLCLC